MQEGETPASWQFTGGTGGQGGPATPKPVKAVSWTASEYIAHEKSTGWFIRFILVVLVSVGLVFLITHDITSVILLAVFAVAFGIFAARKPNVLHYEINDRGITIGQKFYPVNVFRSFALIEEGAFRSIMLLPLKRFSPSISLYYAPEDEKAILDAFTGLLPQETRTQDPVDKLMRRIRF